MMPPNPPNHTQQDSRREAFHSLIPTVAPRFLVLAGFEPAEIRKRPGPSLFGRHCAACVPLLRLSMQPLNQTPHETSAVLAPAQPDRNQSQMLCDPTLQHWTAALAAGERPDKI